MKYLKCPTCGKVELSKVIEQAKYDYYCARCQQNKLKDFIPAPEHEDVKKDDKSI
jgi:DNA-directed RNA polymerase subunit RPC12/RpoP